MTEKAPRGKPPSVMDDLGSIGERMREIQKAEDRKPNDPFAPQFESARPDWGGALGGIGVSTDPSIGVYDWRLIQLYASQSAAVAAAQANPHVAEARGLEPYSPLAAQVSPLVAQNRTLEQFAAYAPKNNAFLQRLLDGALAEIRYLKPYDAMKGLTPRNG